MKLRCLMIVLVVILSGCPGLAPGSTAYAPRPGSPEADLWPRVRRDIFPDDVRTNKDKFKNEILGWTGIVKSSRTEGGQLVTDYEHHFWDWILDSGTQRQSIFLSRRGEGRFRCKQALKDFAPGADVSPLPTGYMGIVYAKVLGVDDGVVVLNCVSWIIKVRPEYFATDIWDYGRDYLLRGDKNDFKVLRVPVFQ